MQQRDRKSASAQPRDRWVVNLSGHSLTEDERRVLEKGLNFAPAPRRVPVLDVVTAVENALKTCDDVISAEVARGKVAGIIRRTSNSLPHGNITPEEREALRGLRGKEDVVIVPADKGNATVLMDRDEYVRKALTIIEHKPFEVVRRCPARQIETTLNKFLWRLFQERRITKPLYDRLHASECPLPRFYGMAKIHKPEVPLRPVISAVGSALYAASKYLAQILKPLVGNDGYTVANSKEFVKSLIDVRLSEDEELVSFDVQCLYTSLPVQRALSVVREVLERMIRSVTERL